MDAHHVPGLGQVATALGDNCTLAYGSLEDRHDFRLMPLEDQSELLFLLEFLYLLVNDLTQVRVGNLRDLVFQVGHNVSCYWFSAGAARKASSAVCTMLF